MSDNLWGNFEDVHEEIREPKEILEKQSDYLKDGMSSLIRGKIVRTEVSKTYKDFYESNDLDCDFTYSFKIISDYVPKYSYQICIITYGITMYPLAISFSERIAEQLAEYFIVEDDDTIFVDNEENFLKVLEKLFFTDEIRQVLKGLRSIAQKEKDTKDLPF